MTPQEVQARVTESVHELTLHLQEQAKKVLIEPRKIKLPTMEGSSVNEEFWMVTRHFEDKQDHLGDVGYCESMDMFIHIGSRLSDSGKVTYHCEAVYDKSFAVTFSNL